MPKLAQRLGLPLPDPFPADRVKRSNLFERMFLAVYETEAQLQNGAIALAERL
jgi:hypothetical protein